MHWDREVIRVWKHKTCANGFCRYTVFFSDGRQEEDVLPCSPWKGCRPFNQPTQERST